MKYLIPTYTLGLLKLRLIGVYSVLENLKYDGKFEPKAKRWIESEVYFFNYLMQKKSENQ